MTVPRVECPNLIGADQIDFCSRGVRMDVATAILAEKDETRLLRDVIESVPVLAEHGGERSPNAKQADNISLRTKHGTSSSYLAARIKRDAPEIAARIDEFPSIRAAALEAGIIRERTLLRIIQLAWGRASISERQEISVWVTSQMSDKIDRHA